MVRPEDVTGQKPIIPKAEPIDQQDEAEDVMEMIEANFDLSTLMDTTTPMAESTVIEETQETIDDMAQFLQAYDPRGVKQEEEPVVEDQSAQAALPSCLADELLSLEQRQTLDQMDLPTQLSEEDLKDAETLLDTLLGSNTSPEEITPARQGQPTADILKAAVDSEGLSDSGFQSMLEEAQSSSGRQYTVANVSHCVTSDGKQVIIVVQRPTEQATSATARKLLPRPSSSDDEDGDPAWQPEHPQKRRPGRKREDRVSLAAAPHGGVNKKSYRNIKDRKERKKIQNVEAARRYRDKKKQEQVEMEAEEAVERARNMRLRGQLKDIQSEVNTMMKLMKELGMLKSK